MENKKLELTINSKVWINLIISIAVAIFIVFGLNYIDGGGIRYPPLYESKTYFGDSIYGDYYGFDFALKSLTREKDFSVIIILSSVFWVITLIKQFIKFKIK